MITSFLLFQLIASVINATCLALLDSGIDLKFLVAAGSCFLDHNDDLQIDIPHSQLEEPKATFVFAFDNIDKRIITSHTTGVFSSELYQKAIDLCRVQCDEIFKFFKDVVASNK